MGGNEDDEEEDHIDSLIQQRRTNSTADNFSMSRHQSIHANEFSGAKKERGEGDSQGFQMLDKLDEKHEMKALANEDYKTKLRVIRANKKGNPDNINPSEVNRSHKKAAATAPKDGSFGSNVISDKDTKDHFDLINAEKDYMDDEMVKEVTEHSESDSPRDHRGLTNIDSFFQDM